MAADELTDEELAQEYGYAWRVITGNGDLWRLFQEATSGKNNWSVARFQAAVRETAWYQDNSQYARDYYVAKTTGGADWQDQLTAAAETVRARAVQLGYELPDADITELADDYLRNGWFEGSRAGFLDQAIGKVADGTGVGGLFMRTSNDLRRLAQLNGITYSDTWFESAAKSVSSGLTTVEDWQADIREQAASLYPVYADKIRGGVNAYDLASPYITRMAQTLELDPNQINLDDTYIKQALGGVDAAGNPSAMGLWDFEKMLRRDDRWGYTKAASDKAGEITSTILRMFGMGG